MKNEKIENKNLNRIVNVVGESSLSSFGIRPISGSSLFHRDFPLINPRSNLIIPCYIYKMPSATGNKRVRVSVLEKYDENQTNVNCRACRSFGHSVCSRHIVFDHKLTAAVFGSVAHPFDPEKKPQDCPPDHTHRWQIFVQGINGEDISYWLKKVQFKLHETYAQNVRTIEQPPFEVTETGWGEFEIQIKLYFVPEANEKPQTLWHSLKLHPYGPDAEGMKERRETVVSQNYEEIIFNEPIEPFYEVLTGGPSTAPGKSKSKAPSRQLGQSRTANIPQAETPGNPYSRATENKELDRMAEATQTVEQMIKEEKERLIEREKQLLELRESEGVPANTKKR